MHPYNLSHKVLYVIHYAYVNQSAYKIQIVISIFNLFDLLFTIIVFVLDFYFLIGYRQCD